MYKPFKMKQRPMIAGSKSHLKMRESAMKMKKSAMKAAKPDFPDIDGDGNTTESMKQAAADKKTAMKLKEKASAMKMKKSAMEMKEPMKMKTPAKMKKSSMKLKKAETEVTADKKSGDIKVSKKNRALGKDKETTYSPIGGGKVLAETTKTGKNKTKTKSKVVSEKKAIKKITKASALKAVSYREAWNKMKSYESERGKFKDNMSRGGNLYSDDEDGFKQFVKDAKAYNKKTYGTTEPTKTKNEASKAMGEKVTKKDLKKTDYSAAIRVDKANPKKTKAELAAEKQKQDDAKEGKMFSDKKRAAASTKTRKDDRKYRKAQKKREKADKALAAGKFDKAQRKYRKALTKEEQGDKARRA